MACHTSVEGRRQSACTGCHQKEPPGQTGQFHATSELTNDYLLSDGAGRGVPAAEGASPVVDGGGASGLNDAICLT
jgi:hypothetical protein